MLDLLAPLAGAVVTVTPSSFRAMGAEQLRQLVLTKGVPAMPCVSVEEAVRTAALAAGAGGVVCALGSLYLSGEVRRAVKRLP